MAFVVPLFALAIIGFIALLAVLMVIKNVLYVGGPNEVMIFSGFARQAADGRKIGYRFIKGGRTFRVPLLEVVGSAANGVDAIELFMATDPDVVTMDITMPHMDGIECVERLVEIKPDVLILVVSALADKATAVEAMEKGANGFLNKPFTDRQLNDALEELLSRR